MTMVKLICSNCGIEFEKSLGEYNRRIKLGSRDFYCSSKCAGKRINEAKKKPIVQKICPVCNQVFSTTAKAKGATYCSRQCASKGSVNENRRRAGRYAAKLNFTPDTHSAYNISKVLKKREAWKYKDIKAFLDFQKENYEFEYAIDGFICDLVLIDRKIAIEFDGPDHNYINELEKENAIINKGFALHRISVKPSTIIHPSVLYGILST